MIIARWQAFRRFQLEHGIQCYAHDFEKANKNECLEKATFLISSNSRDEYTEEQSWIVKLRHYDFEMGLHFDLDDED